MSKTLKTLTLIALMALTATTTTATAGKITWVDGKPMVDGRPIGGFGNQGIQGCTQHTGIFAVEGEENNTTKACD